MQSPLAAAFFADANEVFEGVVTDLVAADDSSEVSAVGVHLEQALRGLFDLPQQHVGVLSEVGDQLDCLLVELQVVARQLVSKKHVHLSVVVDFDVLSVAANDHSDPVEIDLEGAVL